MFKFFKNRKSRKQLLQEIEDLKQEYSEKYTDLYINFQRQMNVIETVSATCITNGRCDENANINEVAKECLSRELMKQLLPYMKYESYPIAGELYERKHYGSIQVVKPDLEEIQ